LDGSTKEEDKKNADAYVDDNSSVEEVYDAWCSFYAELENLKKMDGISTFN